MAYLYKMIRQGWQKQFTNKQLIINTLIFYLVPTYQSEHLLFPLPLSLFHYFYIGNNDGWQAKQNLDLSLINGETANFTFSPQGRF